MLKWIALLFMTIDHVGYYFASSMSPEIYTLLRITGRLAFSIFALYIVKGFTRTRHPLIYLRRMAIGALISHLGISLARIWTGTQDSLLSLEWTNIMVLFSFAITMLIGFDLAMRSCRDMVASMTLACAGPGKLKSSRYDVKINPEGVCPDPKKGIAAGTLLILISFWAVYILNADYGFYGLLTVLFIYIPYDKEDDSLAYPMLWILLGALNAGHIIMALATGENAAVPLMQTFSLAAIPLFSLWGKDRRKPSICGRYFFYFYYPAHIILFVFLSGTL